MSGNHMPSEEETERIPAGILKTSTNHDRLVDQFMKMEHAIDPECSITGVGMAVYCLEKAINRCGFPREDIVAISCLGCTPRITKTIKIDAFLTTQGRAIPFATGMKLSNTVLKIVVLGSNNDLFSIGASHFLNAARRNIDMTVIWINNIDYMTTNGQAAPNASELVGVNSTTTTDFIEPFNLPYLAETAGAVYVARWTALHFRKVTDNMIHAIQKPGFSLIEILAPCLELDTNMNESAYTLDRLKQYYVQSHIKHGANPKDTNIRSGQEIAVGLFVDRKRATYMEAMTEHFKRKLGDRS